MSTLKLTTIQNLSGVEVYTAKAWVNFNGTGTVAIRGSGNVSSITDRGTGQYTVNLTTAMTDVNYAVTGTSFNEAYLQLLMSSEGSGNTTSAVLINTGAGAGSPYDASYVFVAIFR